MHTNYEKKLYLIFLFVVFLWLFWFFVFHYRQSKTQELPLITPLLWDIETEYGVCLTDDYSIVYRTVFYPWTHWSSIDYYNIEWVKVGVSGNLSIVERNIETHIETYYNKSIIDCVGTSHPADQCIQEWKCDRAFQEISKKKEKLLIKEELETIEE